MKFNQEPSKAEQDAFFAEIEAEQQAIRRSHPFLVMALQRIISDQAVCLVMTEDQIVVAKSALAMAEAA